jgi:hypothetical protein
MNSLLDLARRSNCTWTIKSSLVSAASVRGEDGGGWGRGGEEISAQEYLSRADLPPGREREAASMQQTRMQQTRMQH